MRTIPFKVALILALSITFSAPVGAAELPDAKDGRTVIVQPGTYQRLDITANNVTYRCADAGACKIAPGAGSGDWWGSYGVKITGNNVTLDGFDIGGGGNLTSGVISTGAEVKITNNTIHDINTSGKGDGPGGIDSSGSNATIENNKITNVGTSGNDLTHGIYVSGGSAKIDGNTISNVSGFGIHTWHSVDTVNVTNNTVSSTGEGGITIGSGESSAVLSGATIANNTVTDSGNVGIREWGSVSGNEFTNNKTDGISLINGTETGTNSSGSGAESAGTGGGGGNTTGGETAASSISTGNETYDRYDDLFNAAAKENGFKDAKYLKTLAWWESNQELDPNAVSSDSPCGGSGPESKSTGIFQITPACGEGEGRTAEELKDPALNIALGVKHLAQIYKDMQAAHPGCTDEEYLKMMGWGWVQSYDTITGCGITTDERQTAYSDTISEQYAKWYGGVSDNDTSTKDRVRKTPIGEWPELKTPIGELPLELDPRTKCSEATEEEKAAFCTAAGQPESCNLDFSTKCDAEKTEVEVIRDEANRNDSGEASVGWQDNGSKSFNKKEPWGSGNCDGGYGDACMDPDNVKDVGDFIVLDGKPCAGEEKAYCGAEITTRGVANITHGTVEVKAIVDKASGSFHAPGWLMGNGTGANGWPKTGEIDFAEGFGTDGKMYLTVHWGGEGCPGGHCSISKPGVKVDASQLNTYAVRRTENEIVQIINGEETARVTRAEVTAKGGDGGVLFDDPMHYRASKAAGGPWASPNGEKLEAGAVRIQKGSVKFNEQI